MTQILKIGADQINSWLCSNCVVWDKLVGWLVGWLDGVSYHPLGEKRLFLLLVGKSNL